MKSNVTLITMAIAVVLVLMAPIAHSQIAPVSGKTFEGELTKVDTAMKMITVKGMDDKEAKEMSFKYDDETLVVGGDKTIQVLSGKTGSQLRISYRVDRGSNQATKIELIEKPKP